jgi:hypothetical protein
MVLADRIRLVLSLVFKLFALDIGTIVYMSRTDHIGGLKGRSRRRGTPGVSPGQSSTVEGQATCYNATKGLDEEHFINLSDILFHVGGFWGG